MTTPSDLIPNFTNETLVWNKGRLRFVEHVGKGGMGVVYRATEEWSADMKEYAVKILLKAEPNSIEGQCQTREIVMHQIASDHHNVLTLHEVINREKDRFIFLILDYCPGGDLFKAISDNIVYAQNDYLVKKVFIQIIDAVQSIHEKGIYHRDLKPDNILVNKEGTDIFLGDFGLATDVSKCRQFRCGSDFYMSPECIGEMSFVGKHFPDIYYSPEKSDIWALGVILVNMVARRNPWSRASHSDSGFREYWKNDNFLTKMLPISRSTQTLLRRVFVRDPDDRITLTEFREAILAMDTFFLTDKELAAASKCAREVAEENRRDALHPSRASIPAPAPAPASASVRSPTEISAPAVKLVDSVEEYLFSEEDYLYSSPNPDFIRLVIDDGKTRFTIGSVSTDDTSSASSASESTAPRTPEATTNNLPTELDITDAIAPSTSFSKLTSALPEGLVIIVTAA